MGYLLVMAGGILQGAFMLPMKSTRKWAWENTWFVYALTAFLIWPWLFVLLTIPHPFTVLATTSMRSLVLVQVFGLGWGVGAVLGFMTGEWKGASRKAYTLAVSGVAILILAIGVVGYANQL